MNNKSSLSIAIIVLLHSFLCCQPRVGTLAVDADNDLPDSLVIGYDRYDSFVLFDTDPQYWEFIDDLHPKPYGEFLKMRIKKKQTVSYIDSCINNATPDKNYHLPYISTALVLFRYKENLIDTIVISHLPGHIQIRDTIYRDSLVYRMVMKELSDRDSIWLNESTVGVVYYQSLFLGRKELERPFLKKVGKKMGFKQGDYKRPQHYVTTLIEYQR